MHTTTRVALLSISISLTRRNARRRRSVAIGTVLSEEIRHSGASRRTNSAVRAPNRGVTRTVAASIVSNASATPASRPRAIPVCWCSRVERLALHERVAEATSHYHEGDFLGDHGDGVAAEFGRRDQPREDHDRAELHQLDRGPGDQRPAYAPGGGITQLRRRGRILADVMQLRGRGRFLAHERVR